VDLESVVGARAIRRWASTWVETKRLFRKPYNRGTCPLGTHSESTGYTVWPGSLPRNAHGTADPGRRVASIRVAMPGLIALNSALSRLANALCEPRVLRDGNHVRERGHWASFTSTLRTADRTSSRSNSPAALIGIGFVPLTNACRSASATSRRYRIVSPISSRLVC